MDVTNLDDAFDTFEETWSPRLAAGLNGQAVKLAKAEGAFVWHHHEDADELFLVNDGRLRIEFREADDVVLEAGDFLVVPAGVEHRPVAEEPTELVLFEPAGTRNTGTVKDELSSDVESLER